MVAERAEEQLQALALDDRLAGRIVDHQMREVGLAGDRAQRGELGRGEAHQVERARPRVGHIVERRFVGRSGQRAGLAEMRASPSRAPPSSSRRASLSSRRWTRSSRPTGSPQHLGEPDLAIVDCSWHMPATGRSGRDEFLAGAHPRRALPRHRRGRRPGASRRRTCCRRRERFGAAMERLGIGRDDRIVVYDNSPARTAARGWFMLRHFGAEQVAILDGGFQKWIAEGRPTESGEAEAARSAASKRRNAPTRSSPRQNCWPAFGCRCSTPAARPRFEGSEADPRPGVAPGHIPGARNLPFAALYREDGTFKPIDEIAAAVRRGRDRSDAAVRRQLRLGRDRQCLIFAAHLLGNDGNAAVRRQLERMGRRSRRPRRRSGPPSAGSGWATSASSRRIWSTSSLARLGVGLAAI